MIVSRVYVNYRVLHIDTWRSLNIDRKIQDLESWHYPPEDLKDLKNLTLNFTSSIFLEMRDQGSEYLKEKEIYSDGILKKTSIEERDWWIKLK